MKSKSKTISKSVNPTLIRFDWAMKRLLRQKSNFSVLEGFLSVLIGQEVKIINLKESESNQEHIKAKFNRVDIFVENNYHINIVYFELGQGMDYVYYGTTEFRGIHFNDVLQLTDEQKAFFADENRKNVKEVKDLFPFYYIICVKDFNNVAKNSLDEWIYYLKNNEVPEGFTAPGLNEVRERLRYDNLSEQEKRDYEFDLGQTQFERNAINTAIRKGLYQGEAKGLAKGLAKGKAERDRLKVKIKEAQSEKEAIQENVVLFMLQSGSSMDTISSITGLTPQAIEKIKKKTADR